MFKVAQLKKMFNLPDSHQIISFFAELRLSSNSSHHTHHWATILMMLSFVSITMFASPTFSQDQISILTGDVKNCPSIYLSSQAVAYYERIGQVVASGDKDDALRGYRAAIKLGDLASAAVSAVPAFIDQFPRAIHISEIKNARYAGEGTFEDWVSTYIMNEKNKFMLSSPFMDYNNMSLCEQYVEATPQITFIDRNPPVGGTIKSASVDIAITFTVYIASCALSRITGVTLGNTQNDWRIWWAQNGGSGIGTSTAEVSASPKVIAKGQLFSDIVVKGKYRMSLTTGDELIGFVESKDDTSLIFETTDGKPYVFSKKLIDRCDLIDLPKSLQKKNVPQQTQGENTPELISISYDSLIQKNVQNILIEVKISNGSIFKGLLVSIDPVTIKINVEGSIIPMSKEVILGIALITAATQKKNEAEIFRGPVDTVIARSNIVDDWGKAKPDVVFTGSIVKEDNSGVSIKVTDGTNRLVKQADIVRVIKHSQDNSNDNIVQYAKPLNCPQGMVLVDLPPGMQGRPYFKTCVDKYEYPNKEGSLPQGNLSYTDAQQLCAQQGKRLCTAEEWQWTCSSLDAYTYPYGKTFDENRCNSDASRNLEASGSRINCFSRFGAFDMVGNIFEWVTTSNKQPALMGGPYSKCQTVSPGMGGEAKPISGLRCCKSN
jgi:hypothetical protein